jgi:hypothetical protein
LFFSSNKVIATRRSRNTKLQETENIFNEEFRDICKSSFFLYGSRLTLELISEVNSMQMKPLYIAEVNLMIRYYNDNKNNIQYEILLQTIKDAFVMNILQKIATGIMLFFIL